MTNPAGAAKQAVYDELFPIVYAELRRIAAREMRREKPGRTLQTTALVHEAYLRLIKDASLSFENRAHFLGVAARAMREILIEHARARSARKRGGGAVRLTLDDLVAPVPSPSIDVLALDEALAAPRPPRRTPRARGRASLFRRALGRRDGGRAGGVAGHGQARLDARARLAVPRAGRHRIRAGLLSMAGR